MFKYKEKNMCAPTTGDLRKAERIGMDVYKQHQGHNDQSDAMRHAEWNRRMAEKLGQTKAHIIGSGYELKGLFTEKTPLRQYFKESNMDLSNNAEGLAAHREKRAVNPNNLVTSPDSPERYRIKKRY